MDLVCLLVWEALEFCMWTGMISHPGMSPHCPFLFVVKKCISTVVTDTVTLFTVIFPWVLHSGFLISKLMSFQNIGLWGQYICVLCWPHYIANKFKLYKFNWTFIQYQAQKILCSCKHDQDLEGPLVKGSRSWEQFLLGSMNLAEFQGHSHRPTTSRKPPLTESPGPRGRSSHFFCEVAGPSHSR